MLDEIQVISIHGVPRSGTTWLGQIFNSHPGVAYRHQPLFSYRFKDRIDSSSSEEEVRAFLEDLLAVDNDDFILYKRDSLANLAPEMKKDRYPTHLVMKMVRYHHLIEKLIADVPGIKIVGIVRNPCAVINSWLQAPKEFRHGWDPMSEWRYAPSKNMGRIEEYNGFEKWKQVAYMFLDLQTRCSESFCLIQYEDLVDRPVAETERVFRFVGLDMHLQVSEFIAVSRSVHSGDPYAVFKHPSVKDRWEKDLDPKIREEICSEIQDSSLARFLL
jgi:hypothetical protein